ncbi:hypothetical protein scyTo_0008881 [Scyliorhinus torazame]|uniref:Uncharacterized protein n=1 Tax=Scyliorhinus torazame TaxID=75743 RepID=A0A401PET4_SCYTO|nr:hypothetical protein [Scyliorhinus torazame]
MNIHQEDEDFLDKLTPDEEHQAFMHRPDHPTGTDITNPDETSDNLKDMDGKQVKIESTKRKGTDPERTNSSGPTVYTQRYDCAKGQFNDTWHLNDDKVLKLAVVLHKPYKMGSNPDDNQKRDCSTVCATQLLFKVQQTNVYVDNAKFTHNGTHVRKNRT